MEGIRRGYSLSLSRSVGRVGENPGNEVGPYQVNSRTRSRPRP